MLKAPAALDMGLINKVMPADDLEMEARRWAAVLAAKSPVAVQNAKSVFYAAADMNCDKASARLCSTEDAKEGVFGFSGKA